MTERKQSKNKVTIEQLMLDCRHVDEMMAAGVTENLTIRTLELFADVYAKLHHGGSATPHHVNQVSLWSVNARKLRDAMPDAKPRDYFRVEHGTPRRAFARMTLDLCRNGKLNAPAMARLVDKHWKLAVVTVDEDRHLNKIARSDVFPTPEERWAAADIALS